MRTFFPNLGNVTKLIYLYRLNMKISVIKRRIKNANVEVSFR